MEFRYSKADGKAVSSPDPTKKLVLAWDPDFSKLTPAERAELDQAEQEMAAGDFVTGESINWN